MYLSPYKVPALSSVTLLPIPQFYHKLNFGAWVSHCDFHLATLLGTLLIHTPHVRLFLASLLISILPTSQALRVRLQPALHQCWWAGSTPTLQHGNLFYPFDLKYGLEVTVMNWLKGPDVLLVVELPVTVTEGENSIYGIIALQLISRLLLRSHQLLFQLSYGLI